MRTSSWYFSNHSLTLLTSHHLHLKYINYYCDTVIFIVLLWSVQKYLLLRRKKYLLYSFSVEQCIFQGGGLTSANLCKSIIHYQTLKVQLRKLRKLQRDDRFSMRNKSWNCYTFLNNNSRVIHFQIEISWNKSKQKKQLIFNFVSFSGWHFFQDRKRW